MYKLYVMKGMIVQDIDRFISNRLPPDTLEKLNMTHEELRSLIEKQPYVTVKSLDSLTDSEMIELEFAQIAYFLISLNYLLNIL